MQNDPKYENVILDIDEFFLIKGLKKQNHLILKKIVLDVGIGFGKTLEHNLLLLKKI